MNRAARMLPAWMVLVTAATGVAGRSDAQLKPIGTGAVRSGGGPWESYATHAEIVPGQLHLGERARYRAWLVVPRDEAARWIPPQSGGAFTWGRASASRTHGDPINNASPTPDTVRVEIPIQIFALGEVTVPGVRVWPPYVLPADRESIRPMPTLRVSVLPILSAADSAADLRPVRGPLAAPWWERVRWSLVVGVALGLVLSILVIRWARRRKPRPAPVMAAPAARRDPRAEALMELAALRRLDLPARGQFGEHALHLTRILRRFLEATAGAASPGDTTPELVDHLRLAKLDPAELRRLEDWLRLWDRLKFARAGSTLEEARRAESNAEAFIRRPSTPAAIGKVA